MRELAIKRAASGRARAAALAALNAKKAAEAAQGEVKAEPVVSGGDEPRISISINSTSSGPVTLGADAGKPEEAEEEAAVTEASGSDTEDETDGNGNKYSEEDINKAAAKFMQREQVAKPTSTNFDGDGTVGGRTVKKITKIGRNDPCPCGSGKKYKKCCGANK